MKFLSSVSLTLQTNIMPAVPLHALIYILVALQWNVFALISLHLEVVGHASSFAKDRIAMLCCEVLVRRSYKSANSSCYSIAAEHCSNVRAGSTNGAMLYERISAENWCCSHTLVDLSLCIVSPQHHTGNFANACSFLDFFFFQHDGTCICPLPPCYPSEAMVMLTFSDVLVAVLHWGFA